jgi:hypothetical protein
MRLGRTAVKLALVALWGAAPSAHAGAVKPADDVVKEAGDQFDFALWDKLLHKYVDGDGRVDYARIRATPDDRRSVEKLYAQVAATQLEQYPQKAAKEAFYLDAYNLIVWKNVLDNSPKMVNEGLYKFFRRDYIVAGKDTDLDGLEKKIIRPTFKDGRVHMALNCASGGCPKLPAEAFMPDKVNAQLDREARKFCNETRNVRLDAGAKTVYLSHIFEWYDKDFAPDRKAELEWINKRRPADAQLPVDAKVEFVDYDWHLNDPSLKR